MRRGRQQSRRLAAGNDSSDEDMGITSTKEPEIDPKIAIQLADLSNAARDRLTAHDKERDRNVNFAEININRRCNLQGTTEAQNASANREKLTTWNTYGGTESTTNLEDIARGQYHRLSTAQKVQAETRQLRIENKEITAESVDNRRGPSRGTRMNNVLASDHRRSQFSANVPDNQRPLDPAADPSRIYDYDKPSRRSGNDVQSGRGQLNSRGGRTSGRGGYNAQSGRGQTTNSFQSPALILSAPISQTASPTQRKGLGARAANQRRGFQERPWPPAALVGNLESSVNAAGQTVFSLLTSPVTASTIAARDNPAVQPIIGIIPPPVAQSVTESHALTVQSKALDKPLAENFGNWFKASAIQDSYSSALPQVPLSSVGQQGTSAIALTASDRYENAIIVSREDFLRERSTVATGTEDYNTDGRLTPVDFSDGVDSDNLLSDTGNTPARDTGSNPTLSIQESRPARDLISAEIPSPERNALSVINTQVSKADKDYLTAKICKAVETKTDGFDVPDSLTSSIPAAQIGRQNPFVKPELAGRVSEALQIATKAKDVPTLQGIHERQDTRMKPLTLLSPNIAHDSGITASRLPTESYTQQIIKDNGCIASQISGITQLGDCSGLRKRGVHTPSIAAASSLRGSRFAAASSLPKKARSGILHTPAGPGFAWLQEELAKKNLAIVEQRRPEEPAFAPVAGNGLFTKYRDSQDHAGLSDEGEL